MSIINDFQLREQQRGERIRELYNPENIHNCSYCEFNEGKHPYDRFPCGQQICQIETFWREPEEDDNEEDYDYDS